MLSKKISQETITALHNGQRETSNLMELLAVDTKVLLKNVLPNFVYPNLPTTWGITRKYKCLAAALHQQFRFKIFDYLHTHASDTLRALACYLIGEQIYPFSEKLQLIRPLADDHNSGVREWAWLAIREDFSATPMSSIALLIPWALDSNSSNVRRFSSEITRPRGVWCKHIQALCEQPWLGLPILAVLYTDEATYVQKSVGNWLNDAGKSHPKWVKDLCASWLKVSHTPHTEKICKRAMRNL